MIECNFARKLQHPTSQKACLSMYGANQKMFDHISNPALDFFSMKVLYKDVPQQDITKNLLHACKDLSFIASFPPVHSLTLCNYNSLEAFASVPI